MSETAWGWILSIGVICLLIYLFGIGEFEQERIYDENSISSTIRYVEHRPFKLTGEGGGLHGFLSFCFLIDGFLFLSAIFQLLRGEPTASRNLKITLWSALIIVLLVGFIT